MNENILELAIHILASVAENLKCQEEMIINSTMYLAIDLFPLILLFIFIKFLTKKKVLKKQKIIRLNLN